MDCSEEMLRVRKLSHDSTLCPADAPHIKDEAVTRSDYPVMLYLPESYVYQIIQIVFFMLLCCCTNTSVSKIFYCVTLCLF